MEYWLVDAESGNAHGCYLTLHDALEAAETQAAGQSVDTLRLLAMTKHERAPQSQRGVEPKRRAFVRFDLGMIKEEQ